MHHWNYNIEFAKDVIELSVSDHAKIHRFIKYDKKTFMYKDLNGNEIQVNDGNTWINICPTDAEVIIEGSETQGSTANNL